MSASTGEYEIMLTRRMFMAAPALLLPQSDAARADEFAINEKELKLVEYKYQRREMAYKTSADAGTIVVESRKRFLYLVLGDGKAMRYGVSLGKGAKAWTGEVVIKKKKEWPIWIPAPYHLEIKPDLAKWKDGMPGGLDNPMGARALYLYKGEVDTINRIHGSAKPNEIGRNATAGCIGMLNADVVDLYNRVEVGTRVVMV